MSTCGESEELRPLTSFEVYNGRHQPTILLELSEEPQDKPLLRSNTPHTFTLNTHKDSSHTHSHLPLPPDHLQETSHSSKTEDIKEDHNSDVGNCIVLAPPNSPAQLSTQTHETIKHACNPRQRIMEKMLYSKNSRTEDDIVKESATLEKVCSISNNNNNNNNNSSINITNDERLTHNDDCKDKTTSQCEETTKESAKENNVPKEKILEKLHHSVERITKKRKKTANHSSGKKIKNYENVNVVDGKNEKSNEENKTSIKKIEESNSKQENNITDDNIHAARLTESPPPVPLHLSPSYQRTVIAAYDAQHPLNVDNNNCTGSYCCDVSEGVANCKNSKQDSRKSKIVSNKMKEKEEIHEQVKQNGEAELPQQQTNIETVNECCPCVENGTSSNNNNNNNNIGNTCSTLINACRYYPLLQRSVSPASQLNEYELLSLQNVYDELQQRHQVLRVCLTGGPCAGKSILLAEIQSRIPDRTGFQVLCVPEAATLLVTGGMKWNDTIKVEQQLCLIRTQLSLEDQFYALALASHKPSIIISDRGTMDGRAFCSDADFDMILSSLGCSLEILRDRYDMVLHMVTAAIGAEPYYNLDNPARYEDLDGARSSDLKLRQMYVGHPNFRLLDNTGTFTEKIERGLQYVTEATGQVATCRTRFFYVLRSSISTLSPLPNCVPYASYHTHYTILANSSVNDIRLLVKRTATDGSTMYFFKSIRHITATHTSTVSQKQFSANSPQHELQCEYNLHNGSFDVANIVDNINKDGKRQGSMVESTHSSSSSSSSELSSVMYTSEECVEYDRTHSQHNHNINNNNTQGVERSQRISAKEYLCLLKHRDVQHEKVSMRVMHFILHDCSYEVMTLMRPDWARGKQTISVESSLEHNMQNNNLNNTSVLPDFIHIDREVPIEQHTTLFLISHKESGQLYASLVFAPSLTHNTSNYFIEVENNKINNSADKECHLRTEADANEKSNHVSDKCGIINNSFQCEHQQEQFQINSEVSTTNTNTTSHTTPNKPSFANVQDDVLNCKNSTNDIIYNESSNNNENSNVNMTPVNKAETKVISQGAIAESKYCQNDEYDHCNNERDDIHGSSHVVLCDKNGKDDDEEEDSAKITVDTTAKKLTYRSLSTININNANVQGKKCELQKLAARQIKAGDLPTLVSVQENALYSVIHNAHENRDENNSVSNTQRRSTSAMTMRKATTAINNTKDCKENMVPSVNMEKL